MKLRLSLMIIIAIVLVLFTVLSTGFLSAQNQISLVVTTDEDSLTIYIPDEGTVSLEGVGFEIVKDEQRVTYFLEQYSSFRALRFSSIPAPICLRIERNNSQRPLPQDCQQITRVLIQRVADADVFWFDENARQVRTLLLIQIAAPLDLCPAGQISCVFNIHQPDTGRDTTTFEVEPVPISSNNFSYKPVTANGDWEIVSQLHDNIEMVLVPPGCFTIGSSPEDLNYALRLCEASVGAAACQRIDFDAETPSQRICFEEPFWIDKYEVSGEVYGSSGYFTNLDGPREFVTWFEAHDFCEQRGARLPTEAEWEYAARGPDNLIFPWGNEFIFRNVVYKNNSANRPANVERNASGASWVGAHHMSGNVWEWTNSSFLDYPYDVMDGRERQEDTSVRVLRGGSWGDGDSIVRPAYRGKGAPNHRDQYTGFRCVRDYVE